MAQRQLFRIAEFSGGINRDQVSTLIQDNEATEIMNFRLDDFGSLVSRRGFSPFVTGVSTKDFLSIGRWRSGGRPPDCHVIVSDTNGDLVHVDKGGDKLTVVYSGLSTSAEGMFLPFRDLLLYVNGVDDPVVYDGSTVFPLSIDPPAAAPTVSIPASGTGLTGTYKYVYTYFNLGRGWESSPSATSAEVTPSNEVVNVQLVASTHPEVDEIRVYRTLDGGSSLLLLDTVANITATYVDNGVKDVVSFLARYTQDPAPAFENAAFHKGYLFGSVGDTLYWSDAANVNGFPSFNSTRVPFEGNDVITALKSFQDTLVVFGANNTIIVAGDGGSWSLFRQDVEIGCASRKAIVEIDGDMAFLSHSGFHAFPGFGHVAPKLDRLICERTSACRREASAVYIPEERAVWLSMENTTWVIHVPNRGISRYSFFAHAFLQGGLTGYGLPLWVKAQSRGSSPRNLVLEYGGTEDEGKSIYSEWRSKVFQLEPEKTKFLRRIGLSGTTGSDATLSMFIADRDIVYPITVTATGSIEQTFWDAFNWDGANWSSDTLTYFIGALPAQTLIGRTFQLSLSLTSATETKLFPPIAIEYRTSDRFLG